MKIAWLLVVCIPFLFSCEEPETIGVEVQPAEDRLNIGTTDTTTLITYTQEEDSVKSDETSANLLGSYLDPIFGKAKAGFYTQLKLSSANVQFGSNPVLDSIVLGLSYKGFYGDTATLQNFEVYEVIENLYVDSVYYSNRNFQADMTPVGQQGIVPEPTAVVTIDDETLEPQLRIKLDNSFGQRLLDAGGTADLSSTDQFQQFLKGLFVTVNNNALASGEGAILNFDLVSTQSRLMLYYHNDNDTARYDFNIDKGLARVNHFEHDFSTATDIQMQLSDTTLGGVNSYIQSMSGLKTVLKIPHLNDWSDLAPVAINKAELIIKIDQATIGDFPPPSKLFLTVIGEEGQDLFPADFGDADVGFGGNYDATNQEYRFNIIKEIQRIINGEKEHFGFRILASGSAVNANRVVVYGGMHPDLTRRMKLKITFTRL